GLFVKDRPDGQYPLEIVEIRRRRHREMAGGWCPVRPDMPPDVDDQGRHRKEDVLTWLDVRYDLRAVFDGEHLAFRGKPHLRIAREDAVIALEIVQPFPDRRRIDEEISERLEIR